MIANRVRSQRDTITVSEAARRVGLHPDSVKRGINRGEFPGHKVGTRYVIPKEWFESWMKGEKR